MKEWKSKVIYQDVLKHHLITRSMSFNTDYEKAPYAKSTAELKIDGANN
jgi:hypothetical protein